MYRGKEIFKPLNTGRIDENVACVREWVANIFFYRKGDTTIMIDAGYNYDRLAEKMHWLGIDPQAGFCVCWGFLFMKKAVVDNVLDPQSSCFRS